LEHNLKVSFESIEESYSVNKAKSMHLAEILVDKAVDKADKKKELESLLNVKEDFEK
jgi:hypothetical protein